MRVERAKKVGYGGDSSHSRGILSIAVQPGGQRVATGGEDGRTRIWQLDCLRPLEHSSALLALLAEHSSSVTCVRFAPRSDLLASSSSDSSVVVSLHYPNRAPRCLLHLLARRSREGRCKAWLLLFLRLCPFPLPIDAIAKHNRKNTCDLASCCHHCIVPVLPPCFTFQPFS